MEENLAAGPITTYSTGSVRVEEYENGSWSLVRVTSDGMNHGLTLDPNDVLALAELLDWAAKDIRNGGPHIGTAV